MATKVAVLDFFAGCGGVSAGILAADPPGVEFTIVAAIDNDPYCCETYSHMIGTPCERLDISEFVRKPHLLDEFCKKWRLDRFDRLFLIGCAPCQGFAAHRKSIGGTDERRSLFGDFCRIAARLKPDAVLMENVPDIFSKSHWPYFSRGGDRLERSGITLKSRIYNLASFGLPQERFRAVMMGFRKGFSMPSGFLAPREFRTVRDAIHGLAPLASGGVCPDDPMHIVAKHRPSTVAILSKVPRDGGNRPQGVGPACLDRAREAHGGYTDVYGRLAWDRPSVTITARCRTPSCGRFAHPEQNRGLSVREAALLQGFPSDYVFHGPFDDKFKQIGNAVPPSVAKYFAEFVAAQLADRPLRAAACDDGSLDITGPVGPGFAVTINGIKKKRMRIDDAA
jgi:DNA (cytosine-5)-methyltransferase 1